MFVLEHFRNTLATKGFLIHHFTPHRNQLSTFFVATSLFVLFSGLSPSPPSSFFLVHKSRKKNVLSFFSSLSYRVMKLLFYCLGSYRILLSTPNSLTKFFSLAVAASSSYEFGWQLLELNFLLTVNIFAIIWHRVTHIFSV